MSNKRRSFILGVWRIDDRPGIAPAGPAHGGMRALLLFVFLLGAAEPAGGPGDGHWQPPGLQASSATVATVFGGASLGGREQGIERYRIVRGAGAVDTDVTRVGADYLTRTVIAGQVYEFGRAAGVRWSRGPNGLVRLTGSDLAGDDLDRWPAAVFPIAATDCMVAGESDAPIPAWVLRYQHAGDAPRWLYVDRASRVIVREVMRDGVRVQTTSFDEFGEAGAPRHWRVTGGEHDLDVRFETTVPAGTPPGGLSRPVSSLTGVPIPAGTVTIPARFTGGNIIVPVRIGDRLEQFALDTGTSDIEIDRLAAIRIGLQSVFDHANGADVRIGALRMRNVPISTQSIGNGPYTGLLGYDFFAGHIVHIDYAHERLELLARATFVPPAGAQQLATDYREGVPLIAARVGDATAGRFLIDSGSPRVVLLRYLEEHDGHARREFRLAGPPGPLRGEPYLEGLVMTRSVRLPALGIGPFEVADDDADIEEREDASAATTIETPFDGIIGTDVLARFEWWFDYDGGALWLRRAP